MKILVVGKGSQLEELKSKFGSSHSYLLAETETEIQKSIMEAEVVFDFIPSEAAIVSYANSQKPVFVNSVFTTLSDYICKQKSEERDFFFGFCGLPTFVNRSVLEVTAGSKQSQDHLKRICDRLQTDFVCVEDRVGAVTPRVICMVINEAYYTLEEGTAQRDDIDLAMKLGTNYPFGPFEWAKRIGIGHVVNLLDAVYQDTKDERYTVCTLLRSEAENRP
jgi:3-hydroxybutyryl-CoA dehydrogenase